MQNWLEKKAQSTNTKIVKTGAKAAANYFAPGVGGKVVDIASKPEGNQILNTEVKCLAMLLKECLLVIRFKIL